MNTTSENLFTISAHSPAELTAISTSVGSGKTRAAIEYMASESNRTQNFIYVAPTLRLVNQTRRNLEERLKAQGESGRNVHLIHSEVATGRAEAVSQQVLDTINAAHGFVGHVVICTTRTLLAVIARIQRPDEWCLILDEAFAPVDFLEVQLGERKGLRRGSWSTFLDLFQLVPEQDNRVTPAPERVGLVRQIAQREWKRAGLQFQGLQPFAEAVTNPALRVELVGCPENVVEETSDPLVACYVTPEYFLRFREVLFMSALFERTVLHHLWTRLFGVTFKPHPVVRAENAEIRNLHREQGPFVSIGYLLHEEDGSSLRNLARSAATGEEDGPTGERVIDAMVNVVDEYFWGKRYLLQTNPRFDYVEGSALVPRGAVPIPTVSHGLNEWDHFDCVAALAVTNPTPPQASWVQRRTGLSFEETLLSYRIHTQYQAVGRSSVRKARGTSDGKTFLVPSKADADALLAIWEGSRSLGKVGGIQRLSKLRAESKSDLHARSLVAYLQSLPTSTGKVGIRALKALLGDVKRDTWEAVRTRVLAQLPEWRLVGHSFCRI